MPRSTASLLLVALSIALAACAPNSGHVADGDDAVAADPPAAAEPAPQAPAATEGCDADPVQSLVGQQADDALVEQARTGAGAEIARVLKPGQMVTMEYRGDRLNIDVDEAGTVTALRCG
ncbi:I78 family peptidase inhibitor [Luteimonas sp. R10]|uniref:I78 family peptidase inhibitor n=1 Tax=Luteimonas sp. R10 TaxID=3108176 RepID=UPI00308C39EF|nr:I78 family peptidase inhibitor [Luteimonas sp. R10]